MHASSTNSAAVLDRHGLGSPGLWDSARVPHEETASDSIGKRLRDALEELGGLYSSFGRFLGWRSDLLGASYLFTLRNIRLTDPPVPSSVVADLIRRDLGPGAQELAANLSPTPVWNTISRTAYTSRFEGQAVIVQVARQPLTEKTLLEFEKGIRRLGRPEISGIVSDGVLTQFREWIRSNESLERERSFLEVLGRYRGETLAEYPHLIPSLCCSSVLCWHDVEGHSISQLLARGDANAATLVASAVLEQFYSLSMVDGDLDPDTLYVDRNHRLHFRRLTSPISVQAAKINIGIKYTAAVLEGNASLAAQTLIRLIYSQPPLDLEKQLMDEFSGIEPELKVNMWFPSSAEAFENNWRALARLIPARPLFLDCLHRNLVAVGYWNSEAAGAGAPKLDAISEAQWPVVGRLLRTQFGMLLNKESAAEWTFGSGLLMVGAFRELNRLLEEVRENDLTVSVDFEEPRHTGAVRGRTSYGVLLGGLLVALLVSLRWGSTVSEPWSVLLRVFAICSVPLMFWAVSKME